MAAVWDTEVGGVWEGETERERGIEKGWVGMERDWYRLRESLKRDRRNGVREGAAVSLQSRTWPLSSSAEHSLALGEEERVETTLRPFIGSHSSAGGWAA